VSTTPTAAKDVAAFIDIVRHSLDLKGLIFPNGLHMQFFDTFKEYQGRDFHMTGESAAVSGT